MPVPQVVNVARAPKIGDQLVVALDKKTYETQMTLTDNYFVIFNTPNADPVDAANASFGSEAIPHIGTAYVGSGETQPASVRNQLICTKVTPKRRTNTPKMFDVQVIYENLPVPPLGNSDRWKINVNVNPVTYEQDAWRDANLKPILNSAGQPFNPTLKKTYFDEEIAISFTTTGNGAATTLAAVAACKDHYNAAALTMTVNGVQRSFDAATLAFTAPRYSTIYVGQPPYDWTFEMTFRYRSDSWLDNVLDRGRMVIDPATNTLVPARAGYGQLADGSVCLDGKGHALAVPAGGGVIVPNYITFDLFRPADFTALLQGIQ